MDAGAGDELNALAIREVLDADSRPTFVLDLDPDDNSSPDAVKDHAILPVFCNAALRLHEQLFDALVGLDAQGLATVNEKTTYDEFKCWATGVTPHDDSKDVFPLAFHYGDMLWTGSTIRQRWRLISGNRLWRANVPLLDLSSGAPLEVATGGDKVQQALKTAKPAADPLQNIQPAPENVQSAAVKGSTIAATTTAVVPSSTTLVSSKQDTRPSKPFYFPKTSEKSSDDTGGSAQSGSIPLGAPDKAVADWTVPKPKGLLSPHIKYAREVDWGSTPLGPMEEWSPEFRQLVNLCMSNPHPAALFWGSELTMLYNEAYANEVAGNKHPSLMGTGFSGPFAELWDSVGPIFAECARTGISVRKENDYLPINRRGLLEETFFSWSFTPLYGGTKRILGFYNAPFDVTEQVISQRRTKTINKIGEKTSQAKTVKQFWGLVLEGLRENYRDVPFALLYSVGDSDDPDHSSISSGSTISLKCCHFEGSIGVPDGHIAAPKQLDLKRSREGFVPSFREAMRTREPTLLHTRDGTLPEQLLEGINWRGFGDPCREAIIFPVRPTNGDAVLAFLVLGVNPRRPYDDEYKSFISVLNRQLATSLASVILYEDEVRRSRDAAEAAALEKEQLTQQLDLQASRLRRMTELSPLGMFLISPEGVLREANDRFYEMTGHTRDSQYEMSWMDFIQASSIHTMEEGWRLLVDEHVPWSGELQLKHSPVHPVNLHGEPIDCWVLFSAHTEFGSDGSLRSIMGSITDISHLKWAQGLQNRRLQEAEETRRQQNEFIDITSHEMRNPLSAILQCADDISSALEVYQTSKAHPPQDVVESCVDAAHTISLCVQHQKSIVDDILTVSKLDSNLLVITPVPSQPEAILRRAVKMFDPELQAKDIQVVHKTSPSYGDLAVDWVNIDPSRVLQILINLMTNAIKFTAPSDKRVITVGVSASRTPPNNTIEVPGFQYVPSHAGVMNPANSEEWGKGEVLYVRFQVEDTGCGLTPEEKQILFQRFKQASPRTHAQYGGSGLGLFISKRLAELHGGQIGVASEAGVGSSFGFFVQARRVAPPSSISSSQESLQIERHFSGGETVTLNRGVAPQRQDFASSMGPAAGLVATKASPKADPKSISILVVEDNLINQKVLVNQLRKVGCTVHVANDGVEALAFLETTRYLRGKEDDGRWLNVILMDLEMPNMDGLTCVREIRKMEDGGRISRHVPVIAVTANVRDEQVATARRAGMDDVVSKPFRIPELLEKIGALLTGM
ncbi:Hybrid signal transduction histidine kinase K [Coniochaeta hoffmannii]|uniref:Hybrid signal transduction histidine kinase K n=1 Tax=Coniochaeta hoffmannii TaxID=91930 RepID=A0AA38VT24_9PEZI|nr:Hybrid signal transduction histidine kinase K [Coniochaeta hoffmannii]